MERGERKEELKGPGKAAWLVDAKENSEKEGSEAEKHTGCRMKSFRPKTGRVPERAVQRLKPGTRRRQHEKTAAAATRQAVSEHRSRNGAPPPTQGAEGAV